MKLITKTLISCLVFALASNPSTAQITGASYTLTPLKAKYIDSANPKEIILVFKYATKSKQKEKLIISGKMTYSLAGGMEKTEVLGRNNHHTITIFGKDINAKDPAIYNLIADKVDPSDASEFSFLVFYLRGITGKYIDKITFTYGLWEPADENVRIETKYEMNVEH